MSDNKEARAKLYEKLALVAGEAGAVEKDGKNKDQGYSYATPASVFRVLKPLMAKYKLAIVPSQTGRVEIDTGRQSRSGSPYIQHVAEMSYEIVDGETGESMIALWHGVAGTYGDDKGNAKAQTIGLRTFLIQLFQIPAEDADHDPDARDPGDTGQQRRNGGSSYEQPRQTQQTTNGAPGKASEKQIKMLFAIWKNAGYEGSVKDWVKEGYGCDINEMSVAQASAAIESLQKQQAA